MTLDERTAISISEVCALMALCLDSTYFAFDGMFYQHVEGAAMGSPLSLVIANLFMEAFEKRALE